jgi:hypothetical protein
MRGALVVLFLVIAGGCGDSVPAGGDGGPGSEGGISSDAADGDGSAAGRDTGRDTGHDTGQGTGQDTGTTGGDGGMGACTIFPADNPWNTPIDTASVHPRSADYIASIGTSTGLHPDFGTVWDGAPNGIPYVIVPGTQPKVTITFTDWGDESDPGPYPVPPDAPIEGGPDGSGDRHVLVLDRDNCMLYELANAYPQNDGSWEASCGAKFDLRSNVLRHEGWTSADAAGLPIFPGLVRYDEVMEEGVINHAIRFTVDSSQHGYIHPATHYASSDTDPTLPPMGLRVRLKASFDVSSFPQPVKVILTALKKYGMIVADNGSSWYLSGAPDSRWSDDDLATISGVHGSDFEAVYTGDIVTD